MPDIYIILVLAAATLGSLFIIGVLVYWFHWAITEDFLPFPDWSVGTFLLVYAVAVASVVAGVGVLDGTIQL
jgi:hypothetical protein